MKPASGQFAARERAAQVYFDYALTGIIETTRSGLIGNANPAAASISGFDARALRGMQLQSLVAPASSARLQRHFDLLLEQGISQAECRMLRHDGHEIIVELASIQVDDDHFVHVFDDVTEARAAAAELERARAAAEAANRAKSEFLSNISHEMRTPLAGIIGLTQLTLGTTLDVQQHEFLGTINRLGKNLLQIINDLLDTAKIESGRLDVENAPFDLHDLIGELAALRAQIKPGQKLDLGLHIDAEVPRQIMGDRLRLGQCVTNLVGNAIKFTPQGRVDLYADVVEPTEQGGTTLLRLAVEDTGIGIPANALGSLFVPFSQAETSIARRFGGTGLGLHITRELAQAMGGTLDVYSSVGQGSRFTLTLPLQTLTGALPVQAAVPAFDEVPQEFRGRRVFVAEDDAVNQIVIKQWLGRAGISVRLVANGLAVLEQFGSGALDCELVLMDVQMPGLDGLAATRQLRASGQTLPIIGLSAGASPAEQQACLDAGMNDFLAKPLDLDELWGCLTRWLPPLDEQESAPTESVESRFLNDQNALARARTVFRRSHHNDGQRLADLLSTGHIDAAARLAHQLRGSAATLGLTHLAALAGALEQDLARATEIPLLSARCIDIGRELALACVSFD